MKKMIIAAAAALIMGTAGQVGAHDWATGHAKQVETDELTAVVYKTPYCGCCSGYAEHMRKAGFKVRVEKVENLAPIKKLAGVPRELESCHTTVIGDYVVEGHVPIADVKHMLSERPDIRGIALPGMPEGVPGMPGQRPDPLMLYTIEPTPKAFPAE
jgi:hypothetical protein